MIKKFIQIKNVGKFENCFSTGDVELKKLNVVYAENGRGKTTLCDILRSLKTGLPDYIEGRKTLGCTDESKVDIRLDSSNSIYKDRVWNSIYPDIEIFDSNFVYENVFAGEQVSHSNKKNLYQIIVGAEGVRLAYKVEGLDSKIRDANRDIGEKKLALESYIPRVMSIEDFLKLEEIKSIDERIKSLEEVKYALSKADELLKKGDLQKIDFPTFPQAFSQLLSKTLGSVPQDIEIQIINHINKNTSGATEDWISQGVNFTKDCSCPFCAGSLEGLRLFEAYKYYFSENYNELNNEVLKMRDNLENLFSQNLLLNIKYIIDINISLSSFWNQFIKFMTPSIDINSIIESVNEIKNIGQRYLSLE